MYSEFDTLDAYVSGDFYKRRDDFSFVEKHFLKWMLFEFYTPQLCRMMAERQSSLPEDFVAGWPSFIQESPHLSDLVLQDKIDTFWVKRALRVLSGYQACSVPLPAHSTVACKTMNLLSPRGEKLLHRLQKAVLHPPVSRTLKRQAFYAANKFLLDLNNFISFPEIEKAPFTALKARMTVSLSTGCYNQCVHCGYEAKPVLSHMPYPIFLRLVEAFGHQLGGKGLNGQMIYADSDPISYEDPIIGADAADVVYFLKTTIPLQNRESVFFLTKGIATNREVIPIAKMAMSRSPISLSVVLLPGENIQRNVRRVLNTINIYRRYGGSTDQISGRYYSTSGLETVPQIECQGLHFPSAKPCLNGRWTAYVRQHSLDGSYQINGFAEARNLVIKSDGRVWLNCLNEQTGRFDWQQVDDIFRYQSTLPVQRALKTVRPVIRPIATPTLPKLGRLKEIIQGIERI